MIKNGQSNESMGRWHPCGAMFPGKSCRIFCGIFMIVMGIFWLGKLSGWFAPEIVALFWPMVLVLIGAGMIVSAVMGRRNFRS